MATPKIIADFETQLNAAISIGDTSFTMSSATDDDGIALPDGLYYFTLDNGSTNKQYMAGTLSGTTVSSAVNVSRQGVESSGSTKAHRVGATVIMTDFMTYKKYMDEISLVSAPDASVSTKGVIETATLAQVRARTALGETGAALAITPDVAVDLPTADQKAALVGSGNAPDGTNTFVTTDDLSDPTFKPPQVVTFTSSGTWTKDAGLKYVVVEVQAGGGAGKGINTSSDAGCDGGGAGGYTRSLILAASLGVTETVTVGAFGVGVAGSNGGSGGDTTFGSHSTASGGVGASTSNSGYSRYGGAGGAASGGDVNTKGESGQGGSSEVRGGRGGHSHFGNGGEGATGNTSGGDADGYGAGGGGGADTATSNVSGGDGTAGVVIVTEYYV